MLRLLACLSVVLVLSGGCVEVPLDPVAPAWDISVSAALARTTYAVSELITDLATLPPEVLDTLDLSALTLRFEEMVVIGDTSGDGLDDSNLTPGFFQSVREAHLFVSAENTIPVEMQLAMELLGEDSTTIIRIPDSGGTLLVPAAPLDNAGKVSAATRAETDLALDDGVGSFLADAAFLSYTIDISFPGGVTAPQVLDADSLAIRAWGTFISRVEP